MAADMAMKVVSIATKRMQMAMTTVIEADTNGVDVDGAAE